MIKEKKTREKKINSKKKGNAFELRVVNLLKKHWGVVAYRTPGSGAFTSRQVSKAMKEAAVGDIVIEELPEFVIECKNYYSLHQTNWFKEKPGEQSIFGFWNKLADEAELFRKIPLLICKEDSSPIVAIMKKDHVDEIENYVGYHNKSFCMSYDDLHLTALAFNDLLLLDIETVRRIIQDIVNK